MYYFSIFFFLLPSHTPFPSSHRTLPDSPPPSYMLHMEAARDYSIATMVLLNFYLQNTIQQHCKTNRVSHAEK